jgi:hypothetical protein
VSRELETLLFGKLGINLLPGTKDRTSDLSFELLEPRMGLRLR